MSTNNNQAGNLPSALNGTGVVPISTPQQPSNQTTQPPVETEAIDNLVKVEWSRSPEEENDGIMERQTYDWSIKEIASARTGALKLTNGMETINLYRSDVTYLIEKLQEYVIMTLGNR